MYMGLVEELGTLCLRKNEVGKNEKTKVGIEGKPRSMRLNLF